MTFYDRTEELGALKTAFDSTGHDFYSRFDIQDCSHANAFMQVPSSQLPTAEVVGLSVDSRSNSKLE